VTGGARRLVPPLVLVGAFLVAWELYARGSGVSPFVLPPPSRVVASLWEFRDEAIRHTLPTVGETVVGFAFSIVAGTAAAVTMDRIPVVRRAVAPLLVGSQTIPIVAIAPLVVVWFGFGFLPKILVVILVTFFPITVALLDGFASTPQDRTELMRSMGASDDQVFRKLRWPTGLPGLFTGLRISATYAVVAAVIAEYVGATEGLGIWMQLSQRSFRTDLVFAAIVLTAVLSVALVAIVTLVERAVIPWSRAAREAARVGRRAEPA
jgi:ABC-type nitrate/sulfonate/bicarbonate transport system permease component